jgi:GAF domain-containing protein
VLLVMESGETVPSAWMDYTVLRRPFSREQLLECVVSASTPHRASTSTLRRERQRREEAETLLDLALDLTSRLDLQQLLQRATDAATQLTGAAFGAFFYSTRDESGQKYLLYTLSGAPVEAFEKFGTPRNTPLFAATFAGERIVRSDDVLRDPLYGRMEPHRGMPKGHLPVRSYLAVPVVSRGEVLGGLFFGHPEPGMFSQRSERVAAAIAAQAAVAIDNSRLFDAMRTERERRELVERRTGSTGRG